MVRMRTWGAAAVAAGIASVAGIDASPVAGRTAAAGTLEMKASLTLVSQLGNCTPVGVATDCATRTVDGPFPGLGNATGAFVFQMDLGSGACASGAGKALGYPIQLDVVGKGAIELAVSEAAACTATESVRTQTQAFTVTGGTGIYAGASGSGTLEPALGQPRDDGSRHGVETVQGTLAVPGLQFDQVAPTFVGAKSRTVVAPRHAKRVRVKYVVTATDDVDGSVPVTCRPRSGARFRIGRTKVSCAAIDTSANAGTTSFKITARRHR